MTGQTPKTISTTFLPVPLHHPPASCDTVCFSHHPQIPAVSHSYCRAFATQQGRQCLPWPSLLAPLIPAGSPCTPAPEDQGVSISADRAINSHSPPNCKFQALHSQSSPSLNVSSHHYNPLSLLKAQCFNLAILKMILAGTSKEKEPIRNKQLEVRVFPSSAHKIKR